MPPILCSAHKYLPYPIPLAASLFKHESLHFIAIVLYYDSALLPWYIIAIVYLATFFEIKA